MRWIMSKTKLNMFLSLSKKSLSNFQTFCSIKIALRDLVCLITLYIPTINVHFQMLKDKKRQDRLCKMGISKIKEQGQVTYIFLILWLKMIYQTHKIIFLMVISVIATNAKHDSIQTANGKYSKKREVHVNIST